MIRGENDKSWGVLAMNIKIAVVDYPDSLKSAVFGLSEMLKMANRASAEQELDYSFDVQIVQPHHDQPVKKESPDSRFDVVILPPSDDSHYYLSPEAKLLTWLQNQHSQGAILASACAGTFILAATQILDEKQVTTHWGLAALFHETYPQAKLNTDKILINEGDVITAGGMMSWLDLGLEIVAQFAQPSVMRQLGKMLVVDTGQREQRYYRQFSPVFNHGDSAILTVQQDLQTTFSQAVTVGMLAAKCCLTERTFLRRFVKATRLKPTQYIQRLRIQKACDLLETTTHSFEWIANQVGYEDAGACRKVFIRVMGLTPGEFRKRFVHG